MFRFFNHSLDISVLDSKQQLDSHHWTTLSSIRGVMDYFQEKFVVWQITIMAVSKPSLLMSILLCNTILLYSPQRCAVSFSMAMTLSWPTALFYQQHMVEGMVCELQILGLRRPWSSCSHFFGSLRPLCCAAAPHSLVECEGPCKRKPGCPSCQPAPRAGQENATSLDSPITWQTPKEQSQVRVTENLPPSPITQLWETTKFWVGNGLLFSQRHGVHIGLIRIQHLDLICFFLQLFSYLPPSTTYFLDFILRIYDLCPNAYFLPHLFLSSESPLSPVTTRIPMFWNAGSKMTSLRKSSLNPKQSWFWWILEYVWAGVLATLLQKYLWLVLNIYHPPQPLSTLMTVFVLDNFISYDT